MIRYPALFDDATKDLHSIGATRPFLVGRSIQADLPLSDGRCDPKQFQIIRARDGCYLEPLSASTPTTCDGRPVTSRQRLKHDAEIRAGSSFFRFLERDPSEPPRPSKPQPTPSPAAKVGATAPAASGTLSRESTIVRQTAPTAASSAAPTSYPLVRRIHIGRDETRVQILLAHPNVSRVHARIEMNEGIAVVTDLGSANGTFINGKRILGSATLERGDRIDIGPFGLVFDGKALIPDSRVDNLELVGRDIHFVVKDLTTGAPLVLLNGVSVVIRPREFACILGPSGSGKSTLLSALSARVPANEGSVTLNGADLYANFEALKQDIAVVPQRDLLHDLLTVEKALRYTARLRLPPDTTKAEISARVEQILTTVRLTQVRSKPIRLLSGGQSKRASLANEILSKPSLLFLDEVTSGLDEQTDREIMDLFREVADSGKTVVCVTHSTANIERTCHLVVVLTTGGNLAFVGTPAEALGYFSISRLGDVYERLAKRTPEEWRDQYRNSPFYARYIVARLPPADDSRPAPQPRRKSGPREYLKSFGHQTAILLSRYVRITLRDSAALYTMLGQSLTVAALLIMLFHDSSSSSRSLLFLLAVASIWFGCNCAAKEIVKERTVYSRERNVNLKVASYYLSKFLVLACLSATQVSLLLVLVKSCCKVDADTNYMRVWLILLALAMTGVALGLLISAWSRSEDQAVAAVPMVLLPQLILGGGVAPLQDGTLVKWFARGLVTTYWGFDAMTVHTGPDAAYHENPTLACLIITAHILVMAATAIILLDLRDRRDNLYGRALDRWLTAAKTRIQRADGPERSTSEPQTVRSSGTSR